MKKCPYCSAELLDDAAFCLYCMKQLDKKTVIESEPKKSRLGAIIIAVLSALLVCAVIVFSLKFTSFGGASSSQGYTTPFSSQKQAANADSDGKSGDKKSDGAPNSNGGSSGGSSGSSSGGSNGGSDSKGGNEQTELTTTQTEDTDDEDQQDDDADTTPSSDPSEVPSSNPSSEPSSDPSSESSTPSQSEDDPKQIWETKATSGGVEITGIATKNSTGIYDLPSKIDGKTVVGIADSAFYYETSLKSITLPDTLKYIGEQSFAGCSGLTSITIPNGVNSIGNNAFTNCSNLANVYIRSTNISIATYAFSTQYQRSVNLTIHAPSSVMNSTTARLQWDAEYKEWNG